MYYPDITQADVDELFELIPDAKNALQGLDTDNVAPLWQQAAMAVEQHQGSMAVEPFENPRYEIQLRVANAIRALEYGERIA